MGTATITDTQSARRRRSRQVEPPSDDERVVLLVLAGSGVLPAWLTRRSEVPPHVARLVRDVAARLRRIDVPARPRYLEWLIRKRVPLRCMSRRENVEGWLRIAHTTEDPRSAVDRSITFLAGTFADHDVDSLSPEAIPPLVFADLVVGQKVSPWVAARSRLGVEVLERDDGLAATTLYRRIEWKDPAMPSPRAEAADARLRELGFEAGPEYAERYLRRMATAAELLAPDGNATGRETGR